MPSGTIAPTAIRPVEVEEAERLSALMRATFVEAYGHCSSAANVAAFLDSVYTTEKQCAEIANPDILTLVFEGTSDRDWAGFAQLRMATTPPFEIALRRPAELGRIYLSRPFQGLGFAQPLLDRLVQEARARGCDGLWLSVWKQSPRAIAFYEKNGFRSVGITVFAVGDDPKEDWLMVREFETG